MIITCDIEASNLLDESSIDYTKTPYILKPNFSMHCIVVEDHDTGDLTCFYNGQEYIFDGRPYVETFELGVEYKLENYSPIQYKKNELQDFPAFIKNNPNSKVIGHNFIDYDILALKLFLGMDYSIRHNTWNGSSWEVVDTMVMSKCLNPDRFGGHSLDSLGKKVSLNKIDFRPKISKELKFKEFAADMLYYCIRDVQVNTKVYNYLTQESSGWDWNEALRLEHRVRDITTRGGHRGFKFNLDLAHKSLEELDSLMEERRLRVEPQIPPKPATKKFLSEMTPPKRQFKGGGTEISSYLLNFIEKHEGRIIKISESELVVENSEVEIFGERYKLPLPDKPLVRNQVATIDDTTHIKNWLVGLGWNPMEYKMKDLGEKKTKEGVKMRKNQEEYEKSVNRYVEETLASNFCKDRCEHLKCSPKNLLKTLLAKDPKGRVQVLTNPSLTVGQEKDICPNLEKIGEAFSNTKDIVEYLTYRHRRNSILGGGLDWDGDEEPEKGFLAYVREDGRIPTPADCCGTSTSRFKHRVVANIPRATSLYGKNMRAMFGVPDTTYQLGYDFSSLEARKEAHYCFRYDSSDKPYCKALLAEKPNSIHCVTSRDISKRLGSVFTRDSAKNLKYGLSYGAQIAKVSKMLGVDMKTAEVVFHAFWDSATPLKKLKERLQTYWESKADKKFVLGIDGRKVPTRAKHAILNSLFQSGGVICAKQTMVFMEDILEDKGLLLDFFSESEFSKPYAAQLIAYHDEAQLEVSRGLVEFKTFRKTGDEEKDSQLKQEAEEYARARDGVWSAVSETEKAYYVAYSVVGDIISQAVEMTTEKFNLNVPLRIEYNIGRNWAECH